MLKVLGKITGILNLKERSKIVAKNAVVSLFLKGATILLGFIYVPIYFSALGQRNYGIILTITSISSYIAFFDVGIGKGLRIHLGRAMADGNKVLGRQYVSTSYFYVSIILVSFLITYFLASPWIKWYRILNISINEVPNLDSIMLAVIALIAINLIFQLLGTIQLADQKSSMSDLMWFLNGCGLLIVLLVFKWLKLKSFALLLITVVGMPVVSMIIFSLVLFNTRYKWLRPSFAFINHELRKNLLSLGLKFFLIQIVSIIIFSTTNILIAQLFNIGEVARYNIAYKYFNVTVMIFSILMSPLWGAFTNAWHHGDIKWIIKNIKFYLILAVILLVVNIGQIFIYPFFVHIWLKRELFIPLVLSISFVSYNIVFCYNDIFAHFLAGIGRVNKQLYSAVAGGLINIPITIYLAKYTNLGLSSILIANIICLLPSTFVTTIQTIQILSKSSASDFKN